MKKRNFSFSLIAVVIAIAAIALTYTHTLLASRTFADLNWEYSPQGGSTDPLDQDNYVQAPIPPSCTGIQALCGIKAPADANGKPMFSPAVQADLQNHTRTSGKVFYRP